MAAITPSRASIIPSSGKGKKAASKEQAPRELPPFVSPEPKNASERRDWDRMSTRMEGEPGTYVCPRLQVLTRSSQASTRTVRSPPRFARTTSAARAYTTSLAVRETFQKIWMMSDKVEPHMLQDYFEFIGEYEHRTFARGPTNFFSCAEHLLHSQIFTFTVRFISPDTLDRSSPIVCTFLAFATQRRPLQKPFVCLREVYWVLFTTDQIEEVHIFPILAKKMPEFQMKSGEHLEEHQHIHDGMDRMKSYIAKCKAKPTEYSATEFQKLLASWGPVLFYHLNAEVKTLHRDNLRRCMLTVAYRGD